MAFNESLREKAKESLREESKDHRRTASFQKVVQPTAKDSKITKLDIVREKKLKNYNVHKSIFLAMFTWRISECKEDFRRIHISACFPFLFLPSPQHISLCIFLLRSERNTQKPLSHQTAALLNGCASKKKRKFAFDLFFLTRRGRESLLAYATYVQ